MISFLVHLLVLHNPPMAGISSIRMITSSLLSEHYTQTPQAWSKLAYGLLSKHMSYHVVVEVNHFDKFKQSMGLPCGT
tara:strand:+ start:2414 stop:2647 length:234 start_codon:yes stop_codon:yes gene_type:complete